MAKLAEKERKAWLLGAGPLIGQLLRE